VCFVNFVPKEFLRKTLNAYPTYFEEECLRPRRAKLGFTTVEADNYKLFVELLQALSRLSVD
jgi:hypothetical protein